MQLQKWYQEVNKVIKESIREDKNKQLNRQTEEGQEPADKGDQVQYMGQQKL